MNPAPVSGTRHPWNTTFRWKRADAQPRRLSASQVDHFHRQGWVVIEHLIDDTTRRELIAELDTIEAQADAHLQTQPDNRILLSESGAITFSTHAVKTSPAAGRVSRLPAIADVCHDLIGPDVRLYWDQLVYKKPAKPREFPWHQDNGYTYIEPQQYLTIWLALTDATTKTGCPWVAPGAHMTGTLSHEYVHPLGLQCFSDFPGGVPAPVRAGGAVVFSSLTPHRTGPNTSEDTRKTYILQYAPDGAEVLQGDAYSGDPTRRVLQNDAERQYEILRSGEVVEAAR
jgi:ectoine hydroxylase-related dioxygenase (phytanoyl-CoA dioxygenase family)